MTAGLIYDDSRHYLDHLAPLCSFLHWPLIICEMELAELAVRFYPDLEVIHTPICDLRLPAIIVSCDTKPLLEAAFPGQKVRHLWLPHGHSDKGWNSPFFEALREEKVAFVYGQKILDCMHAKNVFPTPIRVGNFRWHYFLKHASFYRQIMHFPEGKNFLYAPTWEDAEKNSSFWNAFPSLAEHVPQDCHLLIKLHPNTVRKFSPEIEILVGHYANKPNIIFLPDDPPIYPLLNICNAYIGDMSSIGYDYLTFNRPMYFLNANQHLPLHQCGIAIDPATFDFSIRDDFSEARIKLYRYTFERMSTQDP